MKKSRTRVHPAAVESPRHLPLVDLLVDAQSELLELAMRSGLKVLEARGFSAGRRGENCSRRLVPIWVSTIFPSWSERTCE